jgi:hypothetical protein
MTTNRRRPQRRTDPRPQESAKPAVGVPPLEERRMRMHAAEGHAGSIPRGNQEAEHESVGQRRREWERLLGH